MFKGKSGHTREELKGQRAYLYPDPSTAQPPLSQFPVWAGKVKGKADERSVDVIVREPTAYGGWTVRVTPRSRELDLAMAWSGAEVPVDLILASPGQPVSGASNAAFRLKPRP